MKLLVTGSRHWNDPLSIMYHLKDHVWGSDITLIHGDAKGADSMCAAFAKEWGWKVVAVPAEWDKYGKKAGMRRNIEMLNMEPDFVVAFPRPDSIGTIACINEAIKRQIPIRIYYERKPGYLMAPVWLARVIKERDDLKEKLDKLDKFMEDPNYKEISAEEGIRLMHQRKGMQKYLNSLNERIRADEHR